MPDRKSHWRMRAEEIRTLSNEASSRAARNMLERLARDYERLGQWADADDGDYEAMMTRIAADYKALTDKGGV